MKNRIIAVLLVVLLIAVIPHIVIAEDTFIQVTKNASIRYEPNYSADKFRLAVEGEMFECIGEDDKWYEIAFDGTSTGFLPKDSCIVVALSNDVAASIKSGNANIASGAVRINKITLSETKQFVIPVGETYRLIATVEPEEASANDIQWTSSNTKVATVDSTGCITAVSKGTTTIKAIAIGNSRVTATVQVQVEEFDLVFHNSESQIQTIYTTSYGGENVKTNTKNKVVDVGFYGISTTITASGISYGTSFKITPIKVGIDTVTFKYGSSRVNLNVYVSPDTFNHQGQKDEVTALEPEMNNEDTKAYTFQGVPWGASYNEVADIMIEQGIWLYGFTRDGDVWRSEMSGEPNISIGNKSPSEIVLYFIVDEDDGTLNDRKSNSRLYQVYCEYQNMTSTAVFTMKEQMVIDYGKPIEDKITNPPEKGINTCIWDKDGITITLTHRYGYSTVSVVFYDPSIEEY